MDVSRSLMQLPFRQWLELGEGRAGASGAGWESLTPGAHVVSPRGTSASSQYGRFGAARVLVGPQGSSNSAQFPWQGDM